MRVLTAPALAAPGGSNTITIHAHRDRPLRVLGIDPGSRVTGFGVIDVEGARLAHVDSGCIHVRGTTLAAKLEAIYEGVSEIVVRHRPEQMAVEQVFVHRNAAAALKLGQARGAALVAGITQGVAVYEYSPNQVKLAVTGQGHAAKEQVQHMMRVLLRLAEAPRSDAADALAVAVCHAHTGQTRSALAAAAAAGRLRR